MNDAYHVHDVDWDTLPDALLPTAKQHMRVEFVRDDDYITGCVRRAIQYFELYSGQFVFGGKADWLPTLLPVGVYPARSFALCPVMPTSGFSAKDADDQDVSANFKLVHAGGEVTPSTFMSIDGSALPAGLAVVLDVGFADVAKLPPQILDSVLRVAATLYENRETVTTPIQTMPFWLNDLLIGSWVPRV